MQSALRHLSEWDTMSGVRNDSKFMGYSVVICLKRHQLTVSLRHCCLRQHHRDSWEISQLNGWALVFQSRQYGITQTQLSDFQMNC